VRASHTGTFLRDILPRPKQSRRRAVS